MKYNYLEALKNDIKNYIEENEATIPTLENIEDLREHLHDVLWTADSVTGNASDSYTFNRWEAEENLCYNIDLLDEALQEYGYYANALENGAEWCDVTIRCYLLSAAIDEVLEEMKTAFFH